MTHTVFHEIAWLLLGAAAAGLLGAAFGQPVMASCIAIGIAAGALFDPCADAASHIRFVAELGVAPILFLAGLTLDWRLARSARPVRTRHRVTTARLHGLRR